MDTFIRRWIRGVLSSRHHQAFTLGLAGTLAISTFAGLRVAAGATTDQPAGSASKTPTPGAASAAPPPTATTILQAADLQADLAIMREAYEALHPGLYRYHSRASLESAWRKLGEYFQQDRTLGETFVAFSEFLARIKCGHTYCNFYNQGKIVRGALLENANRVPFEFRWIDKRMIITRGNPLSPQDEPALAPGTEVLAINGMGMQDLHNRMMRIARADGDNDAKRDRDIEITGQSKYEAFDVFLPLFVPKLEREVEVTLAPAPGNPSGGPRKVVVPVISHNERLAMLEQRDMNAKSGDPIWEWKQLDDQTAYLKMPTWAMYNSKWEWAGWLNGKLNELAQAGTPNLIVDLRGNEGGNDCGNEIISRLIDQDLPYSPLARYVRYQKTPEQLNKYLDTWDDSFRDWGDQAKPASTPALVANGGQTFYRLTKFDDDTEKGTLITAKGPRYRGKVYVIVDAGCSSATHQFAEMIKANKLGTLVGQTTGGSQRGINGGAFFFLRLPNSRIEMDIPLIAGFPSDDKPLPPECGVEPDVKVSPSVDEFIASLGSASAPARDLELEAVKRLIAEGR